MSLLNIANGISDTKVPTIEELKNLLSSREEDLTKSDTIEQHRVAALRLSAAKAVASAYIFNDSEMRALS